MKFEPQGITGTTLAPGGGGSASAGRLPLMAGGEFDSVLSAARAGAEWAWTRLYDGIAPLLLGYLRAQGAAEPEDLASEVLTQLVRSLGSFDGDESSFRSWVLVIAHRKLIDDRRYRGRRPAEPADLQSAGILGPLGNVEQEAMDRLSGARVQRLLSELATDQRDVLLLRILGELTVPEVARVLGKRPGAVESLQHRGLTRLRKLLACG